MSHKWDSHRPPRERCGIRTTHGAMLWNVVSDYRRQLDQLIYPTADNYLRIHLYKVLNQLLTHR